MTANGGTQTQRRRQLQPLQTNTNDSQTQVLRRTLEECVIGDKPLEGGGEGAAARSAGLLRASKDMHDAHGRPVRALCVHLCVFHVC